jgi:hypothetical protein
MKTTMIKLALTIALAAGAGMAVGEDGTDKPGGPDGKRRRGEGVGRALHGEFAELVKAHRKQQHEENMALMDQLKDNEDAYDCARQIKAQRTTQHAENQAFHSELHAKVIDKVKAGFAELRSWPRLRPSMRRGRRSSTRNSRKTLPFWTASWRSRT